MPSFERNLTVAILLLWTACGKTPTTETAGNDGSTDTATSVSEDTSTCSGSTSTAIDCEQYEDEPFPAPLGAPLFRVTNSLAKPIVLIEGVHTDKASSPVWVEDMVSGYASLRRPYACENMCSQLLAPSDEECFSDNNEPGVGTLIYPSWSVEGNYWFGELLAPAMIPDSCTVGGQGGACERRFFADTEQTLVAFAAVSFDLTVCMEEPCSCPEPQQVCAVSISPESRHVGTEIASSEPFSYDPNNLELIEITF